MNSAGAGHHQQRTTVVLAQQAISANQAQLPHRIGREPRHLAVLGRHRQHLPQQWIVRITPPHPRDKTAWYPERESVSGGRGFTDTKSLGVELEFLEQLAEIANRGGEVAAPLAGRPRVGYDSHGRSLAASV